MTLIRSAGAFAVIAALSACNNQPSLYKIAMTMDPLLISLPTTCWVGNAPPPSQQVKSLENIRTEHEWMIWDGTESQYLEMNHGQEFVTFNLGDAATIFVGFLIEGDGTEFASDLQTLTQEPTTGYSEVRRQAVKVTFDSLGATAEGTVDLTSNFDCTGTPCTDAIRDQEGNKSCTASVPFVGRRIDYEVEESTGQ